MYILVMEWVNVKSVVSFIILKVYHAVLFYMPSFTPLAWHRRTLRDEGHNTNVQPIVRSFAVRVSPLPPLSLFNMVMETADRRETNPVASISSLEPATTTSNTYTCNESAWFPAVGVVAAERCRCSKEEEEKGRNH